MFYSKTKVPPAKQNTIKYKRIVTAVLIGLSIPIHGQVQAEPLTSNINIVEAASRQSVTNSNFLSTSEPNDTGFISDMTLESKAEEIAFDSTMKLIVKQQLSQPKAKAYSSDSLDLTGKKDSLYTGKYYDKSREQYRLCIAKRESTFTGSVRGGGGNRYAGFYQFSPELARGAAWMMLPEAKKVGLGNEVKKLIRTPMNKWSRYYQDWAFWRVLNHGEGSHHWAGGRYHCNSTPWAEKGH